MTAKFDFDQVLPEVLRLLGLPEGTFLQIVINNGMIGGEMQWDIRMPAPGLIYCDFKEKETDDICGTGTKLSDAIASACSAYRMAAAVNVVFYSNRVGFTTILQQ